MATMLDTVIKFIQEEKWHCEQRAGPQGEPFLSLNISGDHGQYWCVARIEEERKQFFFYTYYPEKVPENKRREVAEYIARVNYGLWLGNFELDMSDGEVRYKASIDVEDAPLTVEEVRVLVYASISTSDSFHPGLMEVVYGSTSPELAYTHAIAAAS